MKNWQKILIILLVLGALFWSWKSVKAGTCKHENAECFWNMSGHDCCPGLDCQFWKWSGWQMRFKCHPAPTPTPTPTPSPSPSPSPSPTASPTASPTESPSPSPTESPSGSPSCSPSIEPSPTPTETPTESPSPEPGCEKKSWTCEECHQTPTQDVCYSLFLDYCGENYNCHWVTEGQWACDTECPTPTPSPSPAPTASPTSDSGVGGTSTTTTTTETQGEVLGATALPETGNFPGNLFSLFQLLGITLTGMGVKIHAQKNR
jgi:hypothetical protein